MKICPKEFCVERKVSAFKIKLTSWNRLPHPKDSLRQCKGYWG